MSTRLYLSVISEMASLAQRDIPLPEKLQAMLTSLSAAIELNWCACFILNGNTAGLTCEAMVAKQRAPFGRRHELADVTGTFARVLQADAGPVATPREWFGHLHSYDSIITFPIHLRGEVAGAFVLETGEAQDIIRHADFTRLVVSQFDRAIESSAAQTAVRNQSRLMSMMMNVSRVAVEEIDLKRSLRRITSYINDNFPVAAVSIILLDESGREFEMEVASGGIELHPPTDGEWPVTLGVCGRCVQTGEPQLILDPAEDPDYVAGNDRVKSEYVVPIKIRNRILGVLNLESTERDTFTDMVQMVLRNLADQIAGAVHLSVTNQKLADSVADTERQKKELERVNRELQQANMLLKELAEVDSLTGLANRRVFERLMDEECQRASRVPVPVSLLFIDVDNFKSLNDVHGHPYGDTCLRQLARDLKEMAQKASQQVTRVGGEEFAVVMGNTDNRKARQFAEELRRGIESRRVEHRGAGGAGILTVSIGVATVCAPAEALRETLLREADKALYEAKHSGKNCVVSR